jgi:hypothetical protein
VERLQAHFDTVLPATAVRTEEYSGKMAAAVDRSRQLVGPDRFPPGSLVTVRKGKLDGSLDAPREGPFEVVGKNRGGAYRLRCPDGSVLATKFAPQRLQLVARRPEFDADEDGRTFAVAKVVGHRVSREEPGSFEYRVRWADFGPDDDTWQSPASFNSTKPIRDYWRKTQHSG